jgi:hypothetical protein
MSNLKWIEDESKSKGADHYKVPAYRGKTWVQI